MDAPSITNEPREELARLMGVTAPLELTLGLLEVARFIVLVLDPQRRVLYCNPFFEELSGYRLDELRGRDWFEVCVPREYTPKLHPLFERALAGESTRGNVNPIRVKDGSTRVVEWYDRPLTAASGAVTGLLAIGQDISDRTHALEQLANLYLELEHRVATRTAQFDAIFEAATAAIAYLDPQFRFVRVNRAYAAADGHTPDYYVGKQHFELFPNDDNRRIFTQVRDTGEAVTVLAKPFEYAHNPERGVSHWDWTLTPVHDAHAGVEGLVLVLDDVTERVVAIEALQDKERRIAEQLAEKELLLREIHHRVKNNLQVVSSLLYLQSLQVDDPRARLSFSECRARIRGMSLIHEVLCESAGLARVDFCSYLEQLTRALRFAYAPDELALDLSVVVGVGELDIDIAVSCGLIASELVTNAIKHAFCGRTTGSVDVSLTPESASHWRLEVRDDGIGLRHASPDSLGLRLVRTLTAQLHGELELACTPGGTRARVRFAAPG